MNQRIARLRARCAAAQPTVTGERASLLTTFYTTDQAAAASSPAVLRALALAYLLERQTVSISDDEWIVGERGGAPKATPTYPELCCHSVDDLRELDTRSRTRYAVPESVRSIYEETIIPYWEERCMRTKIFAAMSPAWHAAFDAAVFTEFMEQRAPGHAVLDNKIYRIGVNGLLKRIEQTSATIRAADRPDRTARLEQLTAMRIACRAVIRFAERHAEHARAMAATTVGSRRAELLRIADVCSRVPAEPPRTFHDAVQAYWFVHLAVLCELNEWDSLNPGRLDQNLYPFYTRDIAEGRITREGAKELLSCLWIKFSQQPAPPKVGVTDEQSATYNDFTLINVGGVTEDGDDAVNDLSYLILDVIEEMRLPYTGSCIQLSKRNPERFLLRALEIVRLGFGQPSIFNTDAIVQEFLRVGKTLEDARRGGPSGCVTISAFGKESCVLTGYMNWPKLLELALNDGLDPTTGLQIGPHTGDPTTFDSFDSVFAAYEEQLRYFIDLKIEGNNRIERLFSEEMPVPFLSSLVEDCIETAQDYNGSGPRYPTTYIQGVGLGTTTDAMAAIAHCVYSTRALDMKQLLSVLDSDFADAEPIRSLLHTAPKYGNDDKRADTLARRIFNAYYDALDGRPNTKGGAYRVNLLPTTAHIYFGTRVGATADGRHAGVPLSDGISPTQGVDTHGPTAVMRSAAAIDHVRTGGTLLNLRFLPDALLEEADRRNVAALVRTYFRLDGHHVQFNVVDSETLRAAQRDPDRYRDLIVRVAGYSDYFNRLDPALQEEIISRTAHDGT